MHEFYTPLIIFDSVCMYWQIYQRCNLSINHISSPHLHAANCTYSIQIFLSIFLMPTVLDKFRIFEILQWNRNKSLLGAAQSLELGLLANRLAYGRTDLKIGKSFHQMIIKRIKKWLLPPFRLPQRSFSVKSKQYQFESFQGRLHLQWRVHENFLL